MDYRDNPKIKPSNIDNERRCGEYARISTGVHTFGFENRRPAKILTITSFFCLMAGRRNMTDACTK